MPRRSKLKRWVASLLPGIGLMLGGCGGFGPDGGGLFSEPAPPVLERTITQPDGTRATVTVRVEGNVPGRGCQALDIGPDGSVSLVQQLDASSDWSSIRAMVAIVPETVAVLVSPVSILMEAIAAMAGREPMAPPSEIHGCEGVTAFYESQGE